MFPYLDSPGYQARSLLPLESLQWLASRFPGWLERRIAFWSSWVNAQARKRYGASYKGTSLPFGQLPPELLASGTTPPAVALTGRPTIGSISVYMPIVVAGILGVGAFTLSLDGGTTFVGGATPTQFTTAAAVVLPKTGMTAICPVGTYGLDNVYAAATPVAEIILGWLVKLVDLDVMRKRGTNPQDPMVTLLVDEVVQVRLEVQQAADGKDGLWELPTSEDGASAVSIGGVLSYTEASPYVSADRQEIEGRLEDFHHTGTHGGT